MWSLGCVIAELFLGWPLYPGALEYDQVTFAPFIRYTCTSTTRWTIPKLTVYLLERTTSTAGNETSTYFPEIQTHTTFIICRELYLSLLPDLCCFQSCKSGTKSPLKLIPAGGIRKLVWGQRAIIFPEARAVGATPLGRAPSPVGAWE